MKINPIINNTYIPQYNKNDKNQINFTGEVNKNIQLYRSIGEKEYQNLMRGFDILSSGYATSDNRGWAAVNWNSGFCDKRNEPVYFVEFEVGVFPIEDRRSSEADSRYGILRPYNLNDEKQSEKGLIQEENLFIQKILKKIK